MFYIGKEKEVLAMENGGNTRVNCVFEGALSNPSIKPHNHADGPTRERFIRDKYERRKYYDPQGFSTVISAAPAAAPPRSNSNSYDNNGASVGPPSDIARQRLEERRQRISNNNKSNDFERSSSSIAPARKNSGGRNNTAIAKAPASAPVDLLDFGSSTNNIDSIALPATSQTDDFFGTSIATTTTAPTNTNNAFEANFISAPTSAPAPVAAPPTANTGGGIDMFAFLTQDMKKDETPQQQQQQTNSTAKASFGGDIMSLYAPKVNQPAQSFMTPNNGMANLSNSMAGMNFGGSSNGMTGMQGGFGGQNQQQQLLQQQQMMMMMQQQQQQKNQMMFNGNNTNLMMMQQQQQQPGMMMNQTNGGAGGAGTGAMGGFPMGQVGMGGGNPMMMMQQQQQLQQQQQQFGFNNGSMNNMNNNNSSSSNAFGTPMGMGPSISTFSQNGTSPTKQQQQPQVPEKEDPFAQFGMNVFRT
jgi:hypothetical protein